MSNSFYVSDFIQKLMDRVYLVSTEANNIYIPNGRGERISLASELASALSEFEFWQSFSPDPPIGIVLRSKKAILTALSHSAIIEKERGHDPESDDGGFTQGSQTTRIMILLSSAFSKFPYVVKALRERHKNKPPFSVEDEYDVQDLIYVMLLPHAEDLRREEVAPSFAGRAARIDFLLKDEKIVLEIKMTRDGLGLKEIRSQLIEDMFSYRTHADYNIFVAFIYDPTRKIENPGGVKKDLENEMSTDAYKVNVRIVS